MRGLTRDTLIEMRDRKLFWLFIVVTAIAVLAVVALRGSVESMRIEDAPPEVRDAFGTIANQIVVGWTSTFLSLLVFFTVLGTAGLIPSMLSRGRAEFYMSKPISRSKLLLGKLFGIWAVYGAMIVLGGLLIISLIASLYDMFLPGVYFVLLESLVALFVWLSITGLVGVATGSSALAITTTFGVWLAQFGLQYREHLYQLTDSKAVQVALDTLYYILPKHSQYGDLFVSLSVGKPVADWMPLWSSLLFALVLYAAALWTFRRKDY